MFNSYTNNCGLLIVDDEANFTRSAVLALRLAGIGNTIGITDPREVMPYLQKNEKLNTDLNNSSSTRYDFENKNLSEESQPVEASIGIIILDIDMPFIDGRDLLKEILEHYPHIIVIMSTANNEIATAVECIKAGATDYITKPFDEQRFVSVIRQALDKILLLNQSLQLKKHLLAEDLSYPDAFMDILTVSNNMLNLFKYAEIIGQTNLPVLITGETGVGKELMAKAIHKVSGRKGKMISVNVAGIDDSMFRDSLFGHVRGSFTGADKSRKGILEEAAGGTVFLDEIGDLRMESQIKLLRLLQDGTYFPVGSDIPKCSDARIITATNKDLSQMCIEGLYRKDLYYRLQAHEVHIPSLKERKNDIPVLVKKFLEEASTTFNKNYSSLTNASPVLKIASSIQIEPDSKSKMNNIDTIINILNSYSFPGNIRELRGLIFDLVGRSDNNTLNISYLREWIGKRSSIDINSINSANSHNNGINFPELLPNSEEWEMLLIREALKRTSNNKTLSSAMIGLSRQSLIRKLKEMGEE
jgi:DNA-binding NtrC family response regulator